MLIVSVCVCLAARDPLDNVSQCLRCAFQSVYEYRKGGQLEVFIISK
jgi:hypothetical protein